MLGAIKDLLHAHLEDHVGMSADQLYVRSCQTLRFVTPFSHPARGCLSVVDRQRLSVYGGFDRLS